MEKYIEKLLKMINEANKVDSLKKKCEYMFKLTSYASFIYYSGYVNKKEYNQAMSKIIFDPCEEKYYKERNTIIYDLITHNTLLNNFFQNILSLYHGYQLEKMDDSQIDKNIEKHFIDFLKYMNCYDLYEDLNNKKMISYASPILDYSICINNRDDSYIVVIEKDNFFRYLTLSHEIAHAFENKILRKKRKYFDASYNTKIVSITFNRIFMEYLFQNNALSSDEFQIIKNNFEVNYFNFLEWSFLISEAIKYNAFDINDYDINLYIKNHPTTRSLTDYNYSLGSICSFKLFEKWQQNDVDFLNDLPDILRDIDKMSLVKLVNTFNNEKIITQELEKTLIKK